MSVAINLLLRNRSFSPINIESLGFWVDALDFSTFTFNGPDISEWRDKSGNDRHASEPTESAQPFYDATGINGLPSVSFLEPNRMRADWIPSRGDYTGFVVFRTADGTRSIFLSQDDVGTSNSVDSLFGLGQLSVFPAAEGVLTLETHGTTAAINGVSTTETFNDDVGHVSGFKVEGTSYNVFTDTASASATSSRSGFFGADGIDRLALGARVNAIASYNGHLAEVIIYERPLDTFEINQVILYLKQRWRV